MRFFKWATRILIALALLAPVGVGWFWGNFSMPRMMCRNEIISQIPSPDGSRKVVVFARDCGATTDFSTQVSILSVDAALPNKAGNLFIADTDHGVAPSGPSGGPRIKVVWENTQSVVLAYHRKARVFEAEHEVGDIKAKYVATL